MGDRVSDIFDAWVFINIVGLSFISPPALFFAVAATVFISVVLSIRSASREVFPILPKCLLFHTHNGRRGAFAAVHTGRAGRRGPNPEAIRAILSISYPDGNVKMEYCLNDYRRRKKSSSGQG